MANAPEAAPETAASSGPSSAIETGPRIWLWLTAGLPIGWALQRLAAQFPEQTERAYTGTLFPPIRRTLQSLAALSPVSVAEVCIGLGALLALSLTLRGLRRVSRGDASLVAVLILGLRRTSATAGLVYLLFLIVWGFNYGRPRLGARLSLDRPPFESAELLALCEELRDQARIERRGQPEDSEGVFRLEAEGRNLAAEVGAAFRSAAERHPAWEALAGPDPLLRFPFLSPVLTRMGITGIWSPWTAEAHVNDHVPDVLLPFTACHEAAHGRGFAREDAASFVAYAAGRRAPASALRYSASLCALRTALAQLARVDPEGALRIEDQLDPACARDMVALDTFWEAQRGWVTGVARRANDTYIRAQGDARGVHSYGSLVELLLGERRVRGSGL